MLIEDDGHQGEKRGGQDRYRRQKKTVETILREDGNNFTAKGMHKCN